MSDLTKLATSLRADASNVEWPDPAEVRGRGDRRSRNRRIAVVAGVVVIALVTIGVLAPRRADRAAPTGPGVSGPRSLDAIQAAPSGTIFAITHTCVGGCAAIKPLFRYALLRSADLARNWSVVSELSGIDNGPDPSGKGNVQLMRDPHERSAGLQV